MRVVNVGIGVFPDFGVLAIADFLGLTEDYLMSDLILLIDLVILFEYLLGLVDFEIFGDGHIEACFFGIHVSISFDAEFFGVIRGKDGRSFDEKFVCDM